VNGKAAMMYKDPLIDEVRAATERRRRTPPDERFEDLVRRGIIDKEGRVLIQIPPDREEETEDDRDGDPK
jgi:hypothetical protein